MSDVKSPSRLRTVERWTALLAALVLAASWLAAPLRIKLGVSVGAGLMVLNAWVLARIGERLTRGGKARPGLLMLLFNLKMGALIGLIYAAMRYLPIDSIGLLIGVSIFPVAVLIAAVQIGLSVSAAGAEAEGEE